MIDYALNLLNKLAIPLQNTSTFCIKDAEVCIYPQLSIFSQIAFKPSEASFILIFNTLQ